MITPYEVYVLCPQRTEAVAIKFLENCLPHRKETCSEYLYPESSDTPSMSFTSVFELIRHLQVETTQGYGIYWNNKHHGAPYQAMMFFTEDNGLIAGIATDEDDREAALANLAGAIGEVRYGVVYGEGRPPSRIEEFIQQCCDAEGERIIDGVLKC